MAHRLEGQLEIDVTTRGIFISLFPDPESPDPSDQQILDAVSDLLISGWQNKIREQRKFDA